MRDYKQSESKSDFKTGFRLQYEIENDPFIRDDRSCTGSSLYDKQRIDSMFDETRSLISGISQNKEIYGASYEVPGLIKPKVTNSVQARIEKMFTEINISEYDSKENKEKPQIFPVAYLGSIPLNNKVTSLATLQHPLKTLYFNYRKTGKSSNPLQGSLEITKDGLKVKHSENKGNGVLEQVNPFHTIAVWAAVKFVCRQRSSDNRKEYAFMPLIADPDSVDKICLFKELKPNEESLFTDNNNDDNLPLFTIVMKQIGLSRQLECHGFVCASADHAIIIAANLYTALIQAMPMGPHNSKHHGKEKRFNYSASSETCVTQSTEEVHLVDDNESSISILGNRINIHNGTPTRPPRKLKTHHCSLSGSSLSDSNYNITNDIINLNSQSLKNTPYSSSYDLKNTNTNINYSFPGNTDKDASSSVSNSPYSGIHQVFESQEGGDILTKVAIPRSKSFLNAGGPFCSRYTTSINGIGNTSNANCRKSSIGSPLGLNELFQEFRHQEGLNNMDDILNAIINSDGMSFNDLKPIYKEFVLKLALTLTKDELYHRSKSIMQKQKYKRQQIKRRNSCKLNKSFTPGGGLKKVLKNSVTSLKSTKHRSNSFEFTSVLFPSCGNKFIQRANTKFNCKKLLNTSPSVSSMEIDKSMGNSIGRKHCSRGRPLNEKKYSMNSQNKCLSHDMQQSRKLSSNSMNSKKSYTLITENVKKEKIFSKDMCLNQSSSGYFSCSECSYDSETCTCTTAEKCYCSLGKKPGPTDGINISRKDFEACASNCGCDTDSCFESEKCYCNQPVKPSIFEQLKQQGFAASESSLSRSESTTTEREKCAQIYKLDSSNELVKKSKNGLKSSKSLEFLQVKHPKHQHGSSFKNKLNDTTTNESNSCDNFQKHASALDLSVKEDSNSFETQLIPRQTYSSDNLALDYEMFNHNVNKKQEEEKERKVLVVSARDPWGKVIYMGTSRHNSNITQSRTTHKKFSVASEALSVKKSAEIAALFSQVKTEEVIYNTLEPPEYMRVKMRGSYTNTNLENSLGYFP